MDVLAIATQALANCDGYDTTYKAEADKQAVDYYFSRPRGDEIPGTSQVVSSDISAVVEANLAQAMKAFSSDHLVVFQADGADDEDQAQLESDTVSAIVMDHNPGFLLFLEAVKDALMLRNGVVKGCVENYEATRIRKYEDVTPEAYAGLMAKKDIEEIEYRPAEQYLKVRETTKTKRVSLKSVPPENFLYTKNWTSLDLEGIPACGERHTDTRSDMVKIHRFPKDKVYELPAFVETRAAGAARNPAGSPSLSGITADKSQDIVEWFELYLLMDKDGNGIAERWRVCFVPNKSVLAQEEVDYINYATGSVLVNPHRFMGMSMYDKLKQVQDINTGLNRQLLNNADAANKARLFYLDGKLNVDDLNSGLPNGNVRVGGSVSDVRQAVVTVGVPDISAGLLANIEHQKRQRAELGGAALDMSSADRQLVGEQVGSQGLDRAYSVMESLTWLMTKTIGESLVRGVHLLTHRLLRDNFNEPVPVKIRGQWMSPKPSDWKARARITVKPGMAAGDRQRRVGALGGLLTTQLTLADKGMNGILVDVNTFHATLMDWARAAEIENPEQYFIDPMSPQAKQAMAAREKQAQDERRAQANLTQMALGLEQLRIAIGKRNADADRVFKFFDSVLKSETEEAKIVGSAVASLEEVRAKADAARQAADADEQNITAAQKAIQSLKELKNGATDK